MLKTEIHRWRNDQDVLVGSLAWDGKEIIASPASPEDDATLKEIMEEAIGVGREIYTKETPEQFVYFLHTKYRSPYFFATEARDDSDQHEQPVPPPTPEPSAQPEQPTLFAEPLVPERPKRKVVEEEFDRDPKTGLITKRRITTIEEED